MGGDGPNDITMGGETFIWHLDLTRPQFVESFPLVFVYAPDNRDKISRQAIISSRNMSSGSESVMWSHSRFCRVHNLESPKKLVSISFDWTIIRDYIF